MKFLKHIRSKSKVKDDLPEAKIYRQPHSYNGPNRVSRLPSKVLRQIFEEVCPHAYDESYTSLEESTYEGCTLCDVRDLAACAAVAKGWHDLAQDMLYKHLRIDSVHYCARELELAEKRKRKSFLNRNAEPEDPPKVRLLLLMRTVTANNALAQQVQSLRVPYMTREACKPEMARTVAVLHNLRYLDLPEGFFNDDPASNVLKQELQVSCPEIRRMRYGAGSERSFINLSRSRTWQNMEILELAGLQLEPQDLLYVISSFPALQELKFVDLPWLEDKIFQSDTGLPPFPPIQRLTFLQTPRMHTAGLASYLSQPQNREALTQLDLSNTAILPQYLYMILSRAPYLEHVSIAEDIDRSFPLDPPTPPLSSASLKTLHYEITSLNTTSRHQLHPPTVSHYDYLASSLVANPPTLPNLTELYVRDPNFPDSLLLAAPPARRAFSEYPPNKASLSPPSSPNSPPPHGRSRPLSIYTKGQDELEWNFTSIAPPSPTSSGRQSTTRPISLMGADSLSPAWGGGARKSVMVGNGFGGFLAIPSEERSGRPLSSSSNGGDAGDWPQVLPERSKKERKDLWS